MGAPTSYDPPDSMRGSIRSGSVGMWNVEWLNIRCGEWKGGGVPKGDMPISPCIAKANFLLLSPGRGWGTGMGEGKRTGFREWVSRSGQKGGERGGMAESGRKGVTIADEVEGSCSIRAQKPPRVVHMALERKRAKRLCHDQPQWRTFAVLLTFADFCCVLAKVHVQRLIPDSRLKRRQKVAESGRMGLW